MNDTEIIATWRGDQFSSIPPSNVAKIGVATNNNIGYGEINLGDQNINDKVVIKADDINTGSSAAFKDENGVTRVSMASGNLTNGGSIVLYGTNSGRIWCDGAQIPTNWGGTISGKNLWAGINNGNRIELSQPTLGDCLISAKGINDCNLRLNPLNDGYLTIENNDIAVTSLPNNTAWNFSGNRYPAASVFLNNQENTILFNSNAFIIGPGTTTTGNISNTGNVAVTVGGTTLAENIVMSLSCPENGTSTSAGGSDNASGSYLSNFLAIGGSGGGTSNYQGFEASYPGSSFQQLGQTSNSVWYSAASMGKTHGYYLRTQLSKPTGLPPSTNPGVGETLGWLEFDLFCGDATFGAAGQGNGGPGLTGSVLHSEPYAQQIEPNPAPLSGASGDDVVRPNLSIGEVPRNFYGPQNPGVIPSPPGTTTNTAISPYDSLGQLITTNKIWTVSIGGKADSYINLQQMHQEMQLVHRVIILVVVVPGGLHFIIRIQV